MSAGPADPEGRWFAGAPKYAAGTALILMTAVGLAGSLLAPRVPTGSTISASPSFDVKIDLNTANAAELEALPRIGPALARRIIEDRGTRGPFRSVDDLDRVKGIGPKTLDLLRPFAKATPQHP